MVIKNMERLTKTAMLHSTIHQLTKAEKRMFKMDMSKLKKDSDYSKVFSYMANLKTYDEQKIKAYIEKKNINSPYTLINYLFDKLITFLAANRPSSSPQLRSRYEIQKIYVESETIFQLGFIRQAHKMRKKALKMALEKDEYDLAIQCIAGLFSMRRQYKSFDLSDDSKLLRKESDGVSVRNLTKLWGVKMESQILLNTVVHIYNDINTSQEDWLPIIENAIFSIETDTFDFITKTAIMRIKVRYYTWNYEFEKSIQYSKELLRLNEENEELYNFFEDFLLDYFLFFDISYVTKHPDLGKYALEFDQFFDKYESHLKKNTRPDRFKLYYSLHQLINPIVQLSVILLQDSFTIKDVDRWHVIPPDLPVFSNLYQRMAILFSAFMYLLLKEYDRFYECQDEMLQYKKSLSEDATMKWELELLDLIASYEDNTDMYFLHKSKNAIRRSKHKKSLHKSVIYMFKLLDKLGKAKSSKKILEVALPELEALESKARSFYILHFSIWIKWRLKTL